ncbi:MAG: hypothetical protein JNJ77_19055 [Planctomycetia bacterium]|nr:hypothetical protein [Planctomycetia bacterium]
MINNESIMGQLLAVLQEGFEGPKNPWSYFTDAREDAGLLGTLKPLSSSDVSRPLAGVSIVAHVHHLAFGMNAAADWIRGDHTPREWKESWSIISVDDRGWDKVRDALKSAYDNLRQSLAFHSSESALSFGGSIGSIAHLAYHLGAIRQKVFLLGK